MASRCFSILLLSLASLGATMSARAADVPLPKVDYTIDRVVESFRKQLELKTPELLQTYEVDVAPGRLTLHHDQQVHCDGRWIAPGNEVARIEFSASAGRGELLEVLRYSGCRGENVITEAVSTRGKDLQPISWADVQKGKRTFALKPNETERHVRYTDSNDEELASVDIARVDRGTISVLSVQRQVVLSIQEVSGPEVSEVRTRYSGMAVSNSYRRGGVSRFEEKVSTPVDFAVLAQRSGQVLYRVGTGGAISEADYVQDVEESFATALQKGLAPAVEALLTQLPPSKPVVSGGQNQHLLEELRLMLIRVTNRTELEKVRVQILEYIEVAGKGLLQDNRPKK